VSEPRELRGLVPAEILAVLAIALVPMPELLPVALPLVLVASVSRWLRRRSWGEVARGGVAHTAIGATVGLVGLAVAVLVGTPVIETVGQRGIEWSEHPIVRGNLSVAAIVMLQAAVVALATELALRGWIVERMLELSPGPPVLPIFVGALAEAILTPGDLAARLGAGLFGVGLGWLYVAGGRSVVAPIWARVVFQVGVVVLEALQLVG
jgi:hypothetical protein